MSLTKIGQPLMEDEDFRGIIIPAGTSFSESVIRRFQIMHERPCDKYDDIYKWEHNFVWPTRNFCSQVRYGQQTYGYCSKCSIMKSNCC